MKLLSALMFTVLCHAEDCQIAVVEWQDAVLSTRTIDVGDAHTTPIITFGCVSVREKEIVVVMSITNGTPDVFLCIPKAWVTKITPLTLDEPKPTDPPKLTSP